MNISFEPTWESLRTYPIPEWYLDAKFGIFIHWGLYCVPAFGNEWYPRNMYLQGTPEYQFHLDNFGPHTQFGYKDFLPQFTAEQFDPAAWASLFKRAGARYVVPVAEHHDGFSMYDSACNEWNAVKMGPKRDVLGALAQAVRQQGMVFGVSSHRAEHWWFFDGGMHFPSDVQDPRFAGLYGPAQPHSEEKKSKDWRPRPDARFLDDWLMRCTELVDRYKPQVFWFDWWIEQAVFEPYVQKFAAYYYNRSQDWNLGVVINYKYDPFPEGSAVLDIERGQLKDIRPLFWQTDTSISKNSWGYVRNQSYKSAEEIICDLVDIVSKNGCLLLNIGPRPDGTIPEPEQEILLEIGRWLEVNGEAIYGSRPWVIYGEGPTQVQEGAFTDTMRTPYTGEDIRFTTKGNALYACLLSWPGEEAVIHSINPASSIRAEQIGRISLLGSAGNLPWSQNADGLHIHMPDQPPCEHAYVYKIELASNPSLLR